MISSIKIIINRTKILLFISSITITNFYFIKNEKKYF